MECWFTAHNGENGQEFLKIFVKNIIYVSEWYSL